MTQDRHCDKQLFRDSLLDELIPNCTNAQTLSLAAEFQVGSALIGSGAARKKRISRQNGGEKRVRMRDECVKPEREWRRMARETLSGGKSDRVAGGRFPKPDYPGAAETHNSCNKVIIV